MKDLVGLSEKTYIYLINDSSEDKKAIVTKKCNFKRKIKFGNYEIGLEPAQIKNKINHLKINRTDVDGL